MPCAVPSVPFVPRLGLEGFCEDDAVVLIKDGVRRPVGVPPGGATAEMLGPRVCRCLALYVPARGVADGSRAIEVLRT
jgi:hypothetical protein